MADVSLLVNGNSFTGWKSVSVVRTIESLAGSFSLSVADHRADQALTWPIREEDECLVKINKQPASESSPTQTSEPSDEESSD